MRYCQYQLIFVLYLAIVSPHASFFDIYSIPCKDCPKKYVGQTTGTIKKRCSEHRNWCRKKHKKKILKTSKKNDEIAFHFHETGHIIDFDNTAIIAEEKAYWKRLIIEGMEMKKLSLTERANLQMGYEIDPIWDATIMENIKKKYLNATGVEVTVGIYILQMQLRN